MRSALAQTVPAALDLGWHPHLDVWVVVAALGVGYWYAVKRIGPRLVPASEPIVTRWQLISWYAGVALLWIVSDWPFHDIAERSLFIFHMSEHLVIALVVPPLLLLGTPRWLGNLLLGEGRRLRVIKALSRPLFAFFLFQTVLVTVHIPLVVEAMVTSALWHLITHVALFSAAVITWMPVLSPVPEIPRLRPFVAIGYLFAHSLVPTVPASFLTFTTSPIYEIYTAAPRLWGIDVVTDQATAGLIMKLGGGLVLWTAIALLWFRWYRREREWDDLERQLRTS
ncbi:MAG: cytochrome c oxidase assembly protein [Acidimicrobiia bacterium]